MHRMISMCLDAAIAAVVLGPIFLILHKHCFHDKKKTVCYFIFAVYLSAMFAVVGLPDIRYIRFDPHFNFVPFAYMFSDFTNSFLNVLLFVPLGFFLPFFWEHYRRILRTLCFGFCTSLLIEALQIFTFRASDVNDLMTNTLGTLVGWCLARIVILFLPNTIPDWKAKDACIVCSTAFAVMFFLQPFLAEAVWFLLA